ncbi:MAG TPA: protein kinase [Bryobacteraceae bacterium]|nr:protein kinase [Bryobacteraceae bacterium]
MPNRVQDDEVLMSLVELALARPVDEREMYLRSACEGNCELFDRAWKYVQCEQRMNGFLLEPLCSPPALDHPFHVGELLDGRFRIMREVACGGMGIVFEAVDEKLKRRIALKAAKPGFHSRLPPEVRHATEISHPNVCKIYEIHTASTEQGDVDFLTMEFLEGETLAARLERGTLPAAEAQIIARQLCAGLAEAHRNRVIHGDLKSANVILTKTADGAIRAVITDFGLAGRSEGDQLVIQSGAQGGTPAYMAPELWSGAKANVASDIYALGVILYELACGRRPFSEQPTGPVPSGGEPSKRFPEPAHPKWDRILARCLHPDPIRRHRSASDIEQALGPSRSRRWILAGSAAALLAIVSAGVTYERATAPKESVRLALLPFEADRDASSIAEPLRRDTTRQLSRLRGGARTKFVLVSAAGGKLVTTDAKPGGATHVLHGTLRGENGKIGVHAYITDARSHVNSKEWLAEYGPGEVHYLPAALAGMVTGTLGLPPAAGRSVNSAALKDYTSGLSYLRRDSGVDVAVAFMERAVMADPDSALTHAGLSEAQWFKYFLSNDQVWLDRATQSEREAEKRDPDLAAVHRIAGKLEENAGRYELAEAEYRRAIELEPNNSDGHRRLGQVLQRNNRSEEALASFRRALEVEPGNYRTYQALGNYFFTRASYTEAATHFSKMVELFPDEPVGHYAFARTLMNLGRFAEAESELRFAARLHESWDIIHNLGQTLMYEHREREAVPYLLAALKLQPESYFSWMQLGNCYRRLNEPAEAVKAYRKGLEVSEIAISRNPRDAYMRSFVAYFCARLGDRARAESELAQALQLSSNAANLQWMAVATYEALGFRDRSLACLATAPGDLLADVGRWPDFAELQHDPKYVQLLASHQLSK